MSTDDDDERGKSSLVVSALIGIPMVEATVLVKLRMVYANNRCIDWRYMTLRPHTLVASND